MNANGGIRLLIDALNMSSPGGSLLQLEFARSIAECAPAGSEAIFLTAIPESRFEGLPSVRPIAAPRPTGWGQFWSWFNLSLPRRVRELRPDVVYSPGGIVSGPVRRAFPTVNGVNNMLPFTPEHIRHFPVWSPDRLRLKLLQRLYTKSSRVCDTLVVPSRFAIEAMRPFAGELADKTFVAPNPIPAYVDFDPGAVPPHPNSGKDYFFYLSVIFWYKNHLELIEGYRRALEIDPTVPDLVLAGVPTETSYVNRIEAAVADPALGGRARFLGKIPSETITAWLHHATVNFFPSTCETNSFVQAEILGSHGVMACSNIGPMPEVAGGAAELFDPRDPQAIAETMTRLWKDDSRRRELRELSAARAAELTPRGCGEPIWNAAREATVRFARRPR